PYVCRWRRAICYGYGDDHRASPTRRSSDLAFQQQRSGQRSFQRDGSGRKQQRNLHGERVNSSHINFCHHLGFVQQYNSDSKSCSVAVATWKSRKSKEVPGAIEQGKYAKPAARRMATPDATLSGIKEEVSPRSQRRCG